MKGFHFFNATHGNRLYRPIVQRCVVVVGYGTVTAVVVATATQRIECGLRFARANRGTVWVDPTKIIQ